jgi:4-amino-4-deoxy-L-arabinose transferase-like glycosyltransferase
MAARKNRRAIASRRDRSRKVSAADKSRIAPLRVSFNDRAFLLVLAAGVVVRVVVFIHMGYLNNDNHLEVIEYVAEHWLPARADQFNQAYHPPLYYFLAAALLRLGGLQTVHFFSLILSVATLVLIARLLRLLPWIAEKIQPWCLALAAFQPQFIMFGLFVSNDALAIFLGVVIFYQCRRVQEIPSRFNFCLLGMSVGLALLTKATFIVFPFPLILFVWMTGRQSSLPFRQLISGLAIFVLIAGVVGCYKYVENLAFFGKPLVSNLDLWDWTGNQQQPTWLGLRSLFDFNLLHLVRHPVISTFTVHSYPLMLYGSFWYALIPESTFHSNVAPPFDRLGSILYVVALCPTILMAVGAARMGMAAFAFGSRIKPDAGAYVRERIVYEGNLLLIFLLNFLLILAAGWRYDVWSIFQGRLLFPSYFALLVAFSRGMEWAESSRVLARIVRYLMIALIVLFLANLIVDVWLAILYPVNPLSTNHMTYEIDMNAR